VEKYLKARLQEAGVAFPYTHDLEVLLKLALAIEPLWGGFVGAAQTLTEHAVKARYPGSSLAVAQAKTAMGQCKEFRRLARQSLGLKK
jgi:HEPN domain-containing protein